LDLVALGTMADVVHLDQSNRVLIHEGLRRIRAGYGRPGLRALCKVSGIDPGDLRSSALAYQIAPRLNAAGRLEDMTIGVRCLLSDSELEAQSLANKLDALNRERRVIESQMRAEALEIVSAQEALSEGAIPPVVCLYQHDWHEGVVGLIASRIKDRYHRPVVAFARTAAGALKGSARSVPGFHIRDALAAVDAVAPALIERFGGHAMAAGLTLRADGLEQFTHTLQGIGEQRLSPELLTGKILTDGELAPEHFTVEVAQILRDAGPWGQGFPEPSFDGVFELIEQRIVGQAHLKMTLRELASRQILGAIAFNQADSNLTAGAALHLVFRLQVDDYRAQPSVQLVIEHIGTEESAHPA
jgi:single-stranded-DNA-specific exonuclease